jgi:hypothetical protein
MRAIGQQHLEHRVALSVCGTQGADARCRRALQCGELVKEQHPDRPFARALFQPEIRDQLLIPARDASNLRPGEPTAVAVEIRARWIACSSLLLNPEHIVTLLLEPLTTIAGKIPAAISAVSEPYRPLR